MKLEAGILGNVTSGVIAGSIAGSMMNNSSVTTPPNNACFIKVYDTKNNVIVINALSIVTITFYNYYHNYTYIIKLTDGEEILTLNNAEQIMEIITECCSEKSK